MERVVGTPLSRISADDPNAERTSLQLIEALYHQIFRHGFFHGDPHPGNLFVTEDGRVAFIDFGLCGWLSPRQRDDLVTLIIASLSGDADGLARVLLRMGQPRGHVSLRTFTAEVESIRARYLKRNLGDIDMAGFVEECIDAAQRHRIRIASDYAILSKAAVTLEGVIRQLSPDLDLARHVQPYSQRLLRDHYAPDQLVRGAITTLGQLRSALRDVPDQVGQVLLDLESGHLELKVHNEPLQHLGREMNLQTTRALMGILAAALTLATPLWLANEPLWIGSGRIPLMTTLCGLSAATFGFWSFAWHVAGGRPLLRKLRLMPLLRILRRR
jgi:ubiquinone biosynthesis protein